MLRSIEGANLWIYARFFRFGKDREGCVLPSFRGMSFNGVGFMLKAARSVFRKRCAVSFGAY